MSDRTWVVIDLDGTLTIDDRTVGYPERPLNRPIAAAMEAAGERGYGVMVLTARGMRTWKGDRALVEENVRPGVEAWLEQQGLEPDQVHVAKPWCGPRGFYVDDRNLHLEEFEFRFRGPFAGRPVRVEVRGRWSGEARPLHGALTRLERWLDVVSYDYQVDGLDPDALSRLGDALIDAEHTAALRLVVPVDDRLPAVAGWFALHAQLLMERAPAALVDLGRQVGSGRRLGRFALVPESAKGRSVAALHDELDDAWVLGGGDAA